MPAFPRVLREVGGVELADTEHDLSFLPVDRVPIDVEIVELVEAADPLHSLECGQHDVRVEQPHVRQRRIIVGGSAALDVLRQREVGRVDLVEAERGSGRLDVARDVRQLLRRLGRLDLEALDERRVGRAGDHRDERPEPDGDHGEHPTAAPDVDDQEHGGAERDEDQQIDRRELRFDVRVPRAVHEPSGREREPVPLQVVRRALEQGERGEQHRQVRLDLGRHALTGRLHPDAAVQVVGDRGDDDDDQHCGEQPVHDEPQERELEHVEADVGVEERILLTEVDRGA